MAQNNASSLTTTQASIPFRAKLNLCSSYALAAWAWRSWEFIVALVLIELYPDSLLMVSAYGLLDNLARVALGPVVGGFVDRHERLPGARAMLRLQNACIGGSAAAALVLLWPASPAAASKPVYWALMWALTVLGAASSAGSTGVSIALEREAVKTLAGDDAAALAGLNAVMRAVDLTALLAAPLAAGLLMSGLGPFAAVAGMAGYCGVAYVPELLLLAAAVRAAPVLGQPKVRDGAPGGSGGGGAAAAGAAEADERTGLLASYEDHSRTGDGAGGDASEGGDGGAGEGRKGQSAPHAANVVAGAEAPLSRTSVNAEPVGASNGADGYARLPSGTNGSAPDRKGSLSLTPALSISSVTVAATAKTRLALRVASAAAAYADTWRVYGTQALLLPCLALSLLYCTVLSLGFLMTSYLKWSGLSEAEVSAYRGVGALAGLAATAIFPPLSKRAELRFCAAAGITYQLACLAAGVLPAASAGLARGGGRPPVSEVRVLVGGLVGSRTGLWLYDLAVTQLIQEGVEQRHLGSVYGVQSSLQAACEMLSFTAGLLCPNPSRFHWLMLGSLGSVACSAMLVWAYVLRAGRWAGTGKSSGVS